MEYSQSTTQGTITRSLTCSYCGSMYHEMKGIIKYAFVFLESIPCFPVSRKITIKCEQCHQRPDITTLSQSFLRNADDAIFSLAQFIPKFSGLILLILAIIYWQYEKHQINLQSNYHIAQPKVNDFYHVDIRLLSKNLRPHQKYKLAKVIDLTDGIATVVYGTIFYSTQRSVDAVIRSGQISNRHYFGRKEHHYSFSELRNLRSIEAIYKVERPQGLFLHGNSLIPPPKMSNSKAYFPGARENSAGLAFLEATYVIDHYKTAFQKFKKSASMGYKYGQVNLAEMYLAGQYIKRDVNQALYWLKEASLQSYKPAINKYLIVCQKNESCQLTDFYQALTNEGVNFHLNNDD